MRGRMNQHANRGGAENRRERQRLDEKIPSSPIRGHLEKGVELRDPTCRHLVKGHQEQSDIFLLQINGLRPLEVSKKGNT